MVPWKSGREQQEISSSVMDYNVSQPKTLVQNQITTETLNQPTICQALCSLYPLVLDPLVFPGRGLVLVLVLVMHLCVTPDLGFILDLQLLPGLCYGLALNFGLRVT